MAVEPAAVVRVDQTLKQDKMVGPAAALLVAPQWGRVKPQ
jgi:hypothetical protein